MKLLLLFITAIFICCNNREPKIVSIAAPAAGTALLIRANNEDTCHTDSLNHVIDSLRRKLFVSDYKIQRVKYYLGIAIKNPSQTKYLKGWIKRAIQ
jgi:hypothetical protein